MSGAMIAVPEVPWHSAEARMRNFNATTGAFGYTTKYGITGANHHPDRCECQGNPNPEEADNIGKVGSDYGEGVRVGRCGPNGDTTPHKHRDDGSCARCSECKGYEPAVPR